MKDRDSKARSERRVKKPRVKKLGDPRNRQATNKKAEKAATLLAALRERLKNGNADEQKRQIEVLWDALKILRADAAFHMRGGNPRENEEYVIWAGGAWAAYAFVRRLIGQRVRLLVHSRQRGRAIDVGVLERLEADHKDGSDGPFFNALRRGWLCDAVDLNCHGDEGCNYDDPWHRYQLSAVVPVKKDTGKP